MTAPACPASPNRLISTVCLICATLALAACRHEAPASTQWQSPAFAGDPPMLALHSVAVSPASSSVGPGSAIDDMAEAWTQIGAQRTFTEALLEGTRTLTDEVLAAPSGRLLACHAVYRAVESGQLGERFAVVRTIVDRLVKLAPDTAETSFALAWLRWILLERRNGEVVRGDIDRDVLVDLEGLLGRLAHQHPDWDGPGAFDRRRIAAEHRAVVALLAEAVSPPGAATRDVEANNPAATAP